MQHRHRAMVKGRALLLAGMAALAPLSAPLVARVPDLAELQFTPPSGPMTLTRTVWRGLHDGKAIRVQRNYAITITPDGDGYRVDGTLIDAAVDAPPQLAMLAELERQRIEPGLFPFRLDRQGRIHTPAVAPPPVATHPELSRAGAALVAKAPLATETRQQTRAMLDQVIGAARSGVAWPVDLFNPASNLRQDRKVVALPDGGQGEVAVVIAVDRAGPGTLPRSVERTVTTLLDGTESVTREQWTMGSR